MCTVLSSHELSMNLLLLIASNCTFPPSYPTYTLVSGTLTFLPREDGAKHVFKKIKNGMKHLIYIYFQNTFRARIFFSLLFCEILDLFCTISGTRPHSFSQRQPDWMWSVCPWTVSFRFLHYFFSRLPHILKPSNCDQLPITCRKSFLCGIQRRSGRCASWYWIPLHFIFEIHSNIH